MTVILITTITLAAAMWFLLILVVRKSNFQANGERKQNIKSKNTEKRFEEITYHNNAIYKDFGFFIKITLAILGGASYIALKGEKESIESVKILFELGGGIQVLIGALFSVFVFFHQKAKIERWPNRFSCFDIALWQETWMVIAMVSFSVAVTFSGLPRIVEAINVG